MHVSIQGAVINIKGPPIYSRFLKKLNKMSLLYISSLSTAGLPKKSHSKT